MQTADFLCRICRSRNLCRQCVPAWPQQEQSGDRQTRACSQRHALQHATATALRLRRGNAFADLSQPFEARQESVGFIYNRIWAAIKREALAVVAEGVATPEEVDRIFTLTLHSPYGPFRAMDAVGLDVVLDVEEHYAEVREGIPEAPRELLREYLDQGRLGAKSGRGFYDDYSSAKLDSGRDE